MPDRFVSSNPYFSLILHPFDVSILIRGFMRDIITVLDVVAAHIDADVVEVGWFTELKKRVTESPPPMKYRPTNLYVNPIFIK